MYVISFCFQPSLNNVEQPVGSMSDLIKKICLN